MRSVFDDLAKRSRLQGFCVWQGHIHANSKIITLFSEARLAKAGVLRSARCYASAAMRLFVTRSAMHMTGEQITASIFRGRAIAAVWSMLRGGWDLVEAVLTLLPFNLGAALDSLAQMRAKFSASNTQLISAVAFEAAVIRRTMLGLPVRPSPAHPPDGPILRCNRTNCRDPASFRLPTCSSSRAFNNRSDTAADQS
jgi:hypothetical protein